MIVDSFSTYRLIHFASGNTLFFALFVYLSICYMPFVNSELERHRKFLSYWEVTPYITVKNCGVILISKSSNVKVSWQFDDHLSLNILLAAISK